MSFLSKLGETLFGPKPGSEIPTQVIVPPVDLSVPVTNPALVAALAKHRDAKTPESEAEMLVEFKRAIFLVAIYLATPATPTIPGQARFEVGQKILITEIEDRQGHRLLALFTDHQEKLLFTDKTNSTLVMPAKYAMEFALEKGYSGLVVNPATRATMRLDNPVLRTMMSEMV